MIYRELAQDEFSKVPPELLNGYVLQPSQRVTAALEGDRVVGFWAVSAVLHAEPVGIVEEFRKHPVMLKRLWGGVKTILKDMGATGVVGIIPDSVPEDKRIAEWLGAERLLGAVYLWLDKEN